MKSKRMTKDFFLQSVGFMWLVFWMLSFAEIWLEEEQQKNDKQKELAVDEKIS